MLIYARQWVKLMMAAWTCLALPSLAQPFPNKTMTIVSVFASGQGPDIVGRIVAEKLSKSWGQSVIVEPRPGANGFLAFQAVKRANPDGHQLLLASDNQFITVPLLFKDAPYDLDADFVPVAAIYWLPFFVAVSTTGPYKSFPDILKAAAARPGRLVFGMPSIGSSAHFAAARLEHQLGLSMNHVAFKENAALFTAIINGDVDWTIASASTAGAFLRAGKIRFLGIAAKERFATHPTLPTLEEAGGPANFEVTSWVVLFAPSRTPNAVVEKIDRDVRAVLQNDQALRDRFKALAVEPLVLRREDIKKRIEAQRGQIAEVVRRTGIKAD